MTGLRTTAEVADIFVAFADYDEAQAIHADIEAMSREELTKELRLTRSILDGFTAAVEGVGPVPYAVLTDARRRTEEALKRAEAS
jgi:hypothetical protein